MNFIFKQVQQKLASSVSLLRASQSFLPRSYHVLSQPVQQIGIKPKELPLLSAINQVILIPSCGFKYKDVLTKRCKDCFIVVKDSQPMVLCKTHPRHKQKKIMPREKDTWIITHRTTGKCREW